MKITFDVSCLGYSVGGHNNSFEIKIEEWEVEDMTEEEKDEYIQRSIYDYILGNLEYDYEIEGV